MNRLNQHIVFRTIIISLMICLAMPCTAKQDFKKALNIPTYENVEKPNKTTTCQTLVEKSTQKTSVSFQKKITENKFFFSFLPTAIAEKKFNLNFTEQPLSSLVPIYILHEQYRL
ncbi:MAG: hypothetical protein RBR78_11740 [Flavobacteriaceae bacterium]|nr:hypothetical protein [Flavobacteriaceae bacterium]